MNALRRAAALFAVLVTVLGLCAAASAARKEVIMTDYSRGDEALVVHGVRYQDGRLHFETIKYVNKSDPRLLVEVHAYMERGVGACPMHMPPVSTALAVAFIHGRLIARGSFEAPLADHEDVRFCWYVSAHGDPHPQPWLGAEGVFYD